MYFRLKRLIHQEQMGNLFKLMFIKNKNKDLIWDFKVDYFKKITQIQKYQPWFL